MKNIEMVSDGKGINTARANGKVIPLEFLIDATASMLTMLSDGSTRFHSIIPALIGWLRSMTGNEMLLDNLLVTIRSFNSERVVTYAEEVLLGDLDIDALETALNATICEGGTPLGRCLDDELTYLEGMKRRLDSMGTARFQPILSVLTDDDESGMDLDNVRNVTGRLDTLLHDNRLVFLPVGIGNPGQKFSNLTRMMQEGNDCSCKVLTSRDDLTRYFRFLGQTLGVQPGKLKPEAYASFLDRWNDRNRGGQK